MTFSAIEVDLFHLIFQCSVTCGRGQRSRDVKCLDNNKRPSSGCAISTKPSEREMCKKRACPVLDQGQPKTPGKTYSLTSSVILLAFIRLSIIKVVLYGPRRVRCLRTCTKCKVSGSSRACTRSHPRIFLHWYIIEYSIILLADSEGPDQTVDAQADLGLYFLHLPEETLTHDAFTVMLLFAMLNVNISLLVIMWNTTYTFIVP